MKADLREVDEQLEALAGAPCDTRKLVRAAGVCGLTLARVDSWLEDLTRGVVPHRTFSSPVPPRPRLRPSPVPAPPSPLGTVPSPRPGPDANVPPAAPLPSVASPGKPLTHVAAGTSAQVTDPGVVPVAAGPQLAADGAAPQAAGAQAKPAVVDPGADGGPVNGAAVAPGLHETVVGLDPGSDDSESVTVPASEIDRLLALDDRAAEQRASEPAQSEPVQSEPVQSEPVQEAPRAPRGRPRPDTLQDTPAASAPPGLDEDALDAILNGDFGEQPGVIEVDLGPAQGSPVAAATPPAGRIAPTTRRQASIPPPVPPASANRTGRPSPAPPPVVHRVPDPGDDFEMLADDDVLELDDDELELIE
ncbi:MAG: hypothetical protein OXR73_37010 [Myxococcales bacterium]|nr:hypothetical protein [Myxococcales bacterium]